MSGSYRALTDNGTHFTTPGNVASAASIIKETIAAGETFRAHSFELACARNDIDHRLTKLWLCKAFEFSGVYTVQEPNQMLVHCFELPVSNKV